MFNLEFCSSIWHEFLFFFSTVGGEGRENRGPRGDRGDYRRKEGANGDFKPEFRGGLGKTKWSELMFTLWILT